jgi:hypothetical protein
VGPVFIGLLAGVGARFGRAFGTPRQIRIMVIGTLAGFLLCEYSAHLSGVRGTGQGDFVVGLLEEPLRLCFSVIFLVCGLLGGVRILVGNDPLGDILTHGHDPISAGRTGQACPRCGSLNTRLDQRSFTAECSACEFQWRPGGETSCTSTSNEPPTES